MSILQIHPLLLLFIVAAFMAGCAPDDAGPDDARDLRARADEIAREMIIVDGHVDIPYRLDAFWEDVSGETIGGDFDYPRAVAGGLDAPFMSIYIPAEYQETGGAREKADSLIDMVEEIVAQSPDKFAHAFSVADVRRNFEAGVISLPMGMENGAPIGRDLSLLAYFHDRGIRYVTLTHAQDNEISDSSYETTATWNGLSPFGEEVVREMNRLGMIVDVSHISDSAFYDVMRVTRAPVMATHSSARHFTPGWERNMSDDLIRRLAENGGVIMICFGSSFLREGYLEEGNAIRTRVLEEMREAGLEPGTPEGVAFFEAQRKAHPVGSIEDVVAHVNHVVDLVGVDHVGLGSDFDGVFALPAGLQDASEIPNLVYHLLREGYSEDDLRKILGENALRVWSEVERVAAEVAGR